MGLRVAWGEQNPRDPWDVGTTSWHKRVCECCGVGHCWSVFSEENHQYFNFSWLSEQQIQLLLSPGETEQDEVLKR